MENKFWVGWLVIREEKKRMAVPVFARILSHCLSFFFFFPFWKQKMMTQQKLQVKVKQAGWLQ